MAISDFLTKVKLSKKEECVEKKDKDVKHGRKAKSTANFHKG